MNYLAAAIDQLVPNSEYTFTDNDYSTIKWIKLEADAPTQIQIDAEIEAIKAKEIADKATKEAAKAELLARLGITEDEAKLLLS